MGSLILEIFYDYKVLRYKGRSTETLSPHKGGSPPKELMNLLLDTPMWTFLSYFLPSLVWHHLVLTQLLFWFLFTSSFELNRL